MLTKGIERMTIGLRDELSRAQLIAQNQANLDTPGFRQTLTGLRQGKMSNWRDDSDGAYKETGRRLDLAPPPGTYFEVERGGKIYLTGRGDLKMDSQGFLVVGSGEKILGDDGQPIKVQNMADISIDETGHLYEKGRNVATIRRVEVSAVQELGGTIFSASEDAKVKESTNPISVGTLRDSNADLTRNQTDLVATIHRAQIFSQAALLQDGTIDRAIRGYLGN